MNWVSRAGLLKKSSRIHVNTGADLKLFSDIFVNIGGHFLIRFCTLPIRFTYFMPKEIYIFKNIFTCNG